MSRHPANQKLRTAFLPRYSVVRPLGVGGQGTVFLASDIFDDGRSVALKTYADLESDESTLRREFLALAGSSHPNVARALGFGRNRWTGTPFFAMEFIRGRTWSRDADATRGRSDFIRTTVACIHEIARALAYLHTRGVLHLDIKPENVIVRGRSSGVVRPVLIDLGLVRDLSTDSGSVSLGTAPYAPPELFLGGSPTPAYDIYSLGMTILRVVSGHVAVSAKTIEDYRRWHTRRAIEVSEDLPVLLRKIVARMIAKTPESRYRDAGELILELRALFPELTRVPLTYHEPSFVAQRSALDAFRSWLEGPDRPRHRFEMTGGVGLGKTRLLGRCATELELAGGTVVLLRGDDDPKRSISRLGQVADGLEDEASVRILEKPLAERIASLVRERGLFILVDDVDRCDRTLSTLLREVEDRLFGAGSTRPSASAGAGGLMTSAARLTRDRNSNAHRKPVVHELSRWSEAETRELDLAGIDEVMWSWPLAERRRSRRRLHEASGGNPRYYVFGLRALAGSDGSSDSDGEAAIRREISRLDASAHEVLAALALARRTPRIRDLAPVVSRTVRGTRARTSELEALGLVAIDDGKVRVAHAAVREAIVESIPPAKRIALHERWAEVLERSPARGEDACEHWIATGRLSEAARVAEGLLAAAREVPAEPISLTAESMLAIANSLDRDDSLRAEIEEAASDRLEIEGRFEESLEIRRALVDRAAPVSRDADRVRKRRLVGKLAASLHRSGRRKEALAELEAWLSGREGSRASPDIAAMWSEKSLIGHFLGLESAAADAETGLRIWKRLSPEESKLSIQTAIDLCAVRAQIALRRFDPVDAIAWLERGIAIGRKARARAQLATLINNLALALHMADQNEKALRAIEEGEIMARSSSNGAALVSLLSNRAQIEAKLGSFDAASRTLGEIEGLPALEQSPTLRDGCERTRALIANWLGDYDTELWSRVLEAAKRSGDEFLQDFARIHYSDALLAHERGDDALEVLVGVKRRPRLDAAIVARRRLAAAILGPRGGGPIDAATSARDDEPTPDEGGTDLFGAWSDLALSAERWLLGDDAASVAFVERAEVEFARAGNVPGRLEAILRRAEMDIERGEIDRARDGIVRSRELATRVTPGASPSPRHQESRIAILEARIELSESQSAPSSRRIRIVEGLIARASSMRETISRPMSHRALTRVLAMLHFRKGQLSLSRRTWIGLARGTPSVAERRRLRADPRPVGRPDLCEIDARLVARALLDRPGIDELMLRLRRHVTSERLGVHSILVDAVDEATGTTYGSLSMQKESADSDPSRASRRSVRMLLEDTPRLGVSIVVTSETARPPSGRALAFAVAVARLLANRIDESQDSPTTIRVADVETEELETRTLDHRPATTTRTSRAHCSEPTETRRRFIVRSAALEQVLDDAERLARGDLPILIRGESGVGKDHLARTIHRASARATGPFVSLDVRSVPDELFEVDLLGHARGAYTGADVERSGFLVQATSGTFVLEEIGDASPRAQGSLVHVIEHGEARAIGAASSRKTDVRIIATTQHDLEARVNEGKFRRDLYYRLAVAQIVIPPLRERPADIEALIDAAAVLVPERPVVIDARARRRLLDHDWPGNARELIGTLRRIAVERDPGPTLASLELSRAKSDRKDVDAPVLPDAWIRRYSLSELENFVARRHLEVLWRDSGGDIGALARHFGESERSVYRRFARAGVRPRDISLDSSEVPRNRVSDPSRTNRNSEKRRS
jgi:DNA-binding NtrC family response regulator